VSGGSGATDAPHNRTHLTPTTETNTTRPNDNLNVSSNLDSLPMREVYEQPKLVTVKTWYTAVSKQGVTC
jgi:hypothetical protein